ncbi:hypothetical protein COB64_04015 [Candidatus Wolfebacteria bacterium]|nr:MAG: hypothetical protein COB64_04015 [Candidatus Wolfebacteria bacterium]
MKVIIILASIVISALTLLLVNPPVVTNTTIVTIGDETEEHFLSEPIGSQIKKVYGFYNNLWNGASYRFVSITDTEYNRVYEARIDPVDSKTKQFFSNELERIQEIRKLYRTVDESLAKSTSDSSGRDSTISYLTIARELNILSDQNTNRRIALIYSDLMEHSSLIDLYDSVQLNLIKREPDSIQYTWQNELALQDLSGIEVRLIYEPINEKDSNRYRLIANFYKEMLKEKGAKVVIEANLTEL